MAETIITSKPGSEDRTEATFTPFFNDTVVAVPPATLPDRVRAGDSQDPVVGAYPAVKFYYRYILVGDRHAVPLQKLTVQAPMNSGWEGRPVYFKATVGAWSGARTVTKRDISGIFGLVDVPVYEADFVVTDEDGVPAAETAPGLADAVKQERQVAIEIRDGSESGPILMAGTIDMAAHHDRLVDVAQTLNQAASDLKSQTCHDGP